jgi:hypothetical protein
MDPIKLRRNRSKTLQLILQLVPSIQPEIAKILESLIALQRHALEKLNQKRRVSISPPGLINKRGATGNPTTHNNEQLIFDN